MKELRQLVIKQREDGLYPYEDETLLPPSVIELTRNERTVLKCIIIDSQNFNIAEAVLHDVRDLTNDERSALEKIVKNSHEKTTS